MLDLSLQYTAHLDALTGMSAPRHSTRTEDDRVQVICYDKRLMRTSHRKRLWAG